MHRKPWNDLAIYGTVLTLILIGGPANLAGQQDSTQAMPMTHDGMMAPNTMFAGGNGHTVTGGYDLVMKDGKQWLTLREDFSLDKAPDPYVVLSGDAMGRSPGALNLGPLHKLKGSSTFAIPAGVDLTQFSKVVIWCKKFDVTLGAAEFAAPKGDMMMHH